MKAALGSRLLYGQNDSLDAEVNEVLVASEGINELLDHLHKMDARPLVITSRDRTDVLWTLLTAHSNPVGPRVAGILLTSEGTGPTWVSVCLSVCLPACLPACLAGCESAACLLKCVSNQGATEGAGSELMVSIMQCSIRKKRSDYNEIITHAYDAFVNAPFFCWQTASGDTLLAGWKLEGNAIVNNKRILHHHSCLHTHQ